MPLESLERLVGPRLDHCGLLRWSASRMVRGIVIHTPKRCQGFLSLEFRCTARFRGLALRGLAFLWDIFDRRRVVLEVCRRDEIHRALIQVSIESLPGGLRFARTR